LSSRSKIILDHASKMTYLSLPPRHQELLWHLL